MLDQGITAWCMHCCLSLLKKDIPRRKLIGLSGRDMKMSPDSKSRDSVPSGFLCLERPNES